ncbi:MAG: succinate dehydrogenase, cytochrome b556 subunit [Alphaproteobacteria bacterium]|nr:succinate dehydrogenase, cytochrome b556 subunit [Alphaproteobacteria bacterium]
MAASGPTPKNAPERPLSPHLQVYRMSNLTSLTSILHRITGVGLCLGLLIAVWLVFAAATGEEAFAQAVTCLSSSAGQVVLIGLSWAGFYHLLTGIRHLFFDMGYLFKIQHAETSGVLIILGSIFFTAATWLYLWG